MGENAKTNLTGRQLQLWAWQKAYPENTAYNVAFAYVLEGPLDKAAFQEAFRTLVRGADALRTVFVSVDGIPRQSTLPNLPFQLPVIELATAAAEKRAAFHHFARRRCRETRFDLGQRLFDAALVPLPDGHWGWYFCLHHLVADTWSHWLAFERLAHYYEIACRGELPSPPSLPAYREAVLAELAYEETAAYHDTRAYWQQKIARPLERLSLYGRTAPPEGDFEICRRSVELDREKTARLQALAQRPEIALANTKATLHNLIMALCAAYLHRVSGVRELALGPPFHGRYTPEARKTIGYFSTVLPLHVQIDRGESLLSLTAKITAEAQTALARRRAAVPNPINQPAYEAAVNYHPMVFPMFNDAPVDVYWVPQGHERNLLAVHVHNFNDNGRLTLDFDIRRDVLDKGQQAAVPRHFLQLMDSLLADCERPIETADLLTTGDKERLKAFNQTAAPLPPFRTVVDWFEQQVRERPDSTALTFQEQRLDYAGLNRRANRVAHYLQSLGVGAETFVGLCLERSPQMIVAVLAVLKAGGAFVPLDPAYPADRLRLMLEETGAGVLLTQSHLADSLSGQTRRVACLDGTAFDDLPDENPAVSIDPEQLAYVIYTSGSTGRPKGVTVTHRGITNLVQSQMTCWTIGPQSRVLQFASLNFDAAVSEIFVTLSAGAVLCLMTREQLLSGPALIRLLHEQSVTAVTLPPSVLAVLSPADLPQLETLIVAGESCPAKVVERWAPGRGFFNAYGPTEATVCATMAACGPGDHPLPIGRPVDNCQVYILDSHLQQVPVGVPGELYVTGLGVGYGYLKRPGLTAERFVPNPFANDEKSAGSVLYRTGDRARYLPDGNIVYIGRLDQQLKVRGYRLEPGEIESYLHEHPAVKQAIVVTHEPAAVKGEKWLAAYILLRPEMEAAADELRRFLSGKVPEFMIPAVFSFLEQLPLTPSGKVNRRALPEPEVSRVRLTAEPDGEVEKELAQIWTGLLGRDAIGRDESFFELGGHSLLAVRLFAQIEDQFGSKLPLATLFQAPTIAQLAAALRQAGYTPPWSPLVQVRPGEKQPPFYCIHGVGGHLLRYYDLAQALPPGRPIYGLQTLGLDGRQPLHDTIEAMAAHYLAEIQAVQPQEPYLLGGLSLGGFIALEMARQLHDQGQQVGLVALFDTSVTQAPRFRAAMSRADLLRFQARSLVKKIQFQASKLPFRPLIKQQPANGRVKGEYKDLVTEWGLNVSDSEPAMQQVMSANRTALFKYVPHPYPVKVALFKSLDHGGGRYYGWNQLALGGVEIYDIPGSHVSILQKPNVHLLAERLEACINKVLEEKGGIHYAVG